MDSRIWIILTDDWELPGNGRGDVDTHQRQPALRLMKLYERLGISATFCVDGLQADAFQRESFGRPHLSRELSLWEMTVREMAERGFDVQAHAHAQWLDAIWQDTQWNVGSNWNLACYPLERQESAICQVRERLMALHPRICPLAFRGGSWGVYSAGRGNLIPVLARQGFRIDVSIAPGLHMDGDAICLDYRNLESDFFPWWPDSEDPRRIGLEAGPIVMVPTQTFAASDVQRWRWLTSRVVARVHRIKSRFRDSGFLQPSMAGHSSQLHEDPFGLVSGKARSERIVLDFTGSLDLPAWRLAIDSAIHRALAGEGDIVPIVLENHSKRFTRRHEYLLQAVVTYLRHRWGSLIRFGTLGELAAVSGQLKPLFKGRSLSVRKACLHQAVEQRLIIVSRVSRGVNPQMEMPDSTMTSPCVEETLRRLMVTRRRKLERNPGNEELRGKVKSELRELTAFARSDLRGLDAWNVFWEIDPELIDPTLYLGLLQTWRKKLS